MAPMRLAHCATLAPHTRREGQWTGLLLAHTVMVLPYVLLALSPAYLGNW